MTWAAFARRAYQAARDWGVQPSEFRALSPAEWWAEFDARMDANDRIEAEMQTHKRPGGRSEFSKAQWDAARKAHSEKMRQKL